MFDELYLAPQKKKERATQKVDYRSAKSARVINPTLNPGLTAPGTRNDSERTERLVSPKVSPRLGYKRCALKWRVNIQTQTSISLC